MNDEDDISENEKHAQKLSEFGDYWVDDSPLCMAFRAGAAALRRLDQLGQTLRDAEGRFAPKPATDLDPSVEWDHVAAHKDAARKLAEEARSVRADIERDIDSPESWGAINAAIHDAGYLAEADYCRERIEDLPRLADRIAEIVAELKRLRDENERIHDRYVPEKAPNLRDQFAMAALTGIHANALWDETPLGGVARAAYMSADAMLAARKGVEASDE